MNICHLTTTHRADSARITREVETLRRVGHTVSIECITPGYPKWQHPLHLLRLTIKAFRIDADAFHCHEPDALIIGLLQKLRGAKVVYDVHEHWPSELPRNIGAPSVIAPLIDLVEQWLARWTDAVVAVSESVGIRFEKSIILPNYPYINSEYPLSSPDPSINLHTYSCMAAKIQTFHGIPESLTAIDQLKVEWNDAHLTLIGNIAVSIPSDAPVTCTGYIPHNQIHAALQSSGIGLVLLQPEYYNIQIGLPNKLFSYMAAGVPVIASDLPEIRQVVKDANCGILVSPGNVNEIVMAAHWLADHPEEAQTLGRNGQEAIVSRYQWKNVEERLTKVYDTFRTANKNRNLIDR